MKIKYAFAAILILITFCTKSQCLQDQSDTFWKIGAQYSTTRISNCSPNYNCHGFVINYLEKLCQPPYPPISGIDSSTPPYACPTSVGVKNKSEWQETGKYVKICNEQDSKVVFYKLLGVADGHSAVKVFSQSGVYKYMSKYGADGPLVAHDLNGSWYHILNQVEAGLTEFWTYVGPIQGATTVVGTGAKTFSVINSPGVTYSWWCPQVMKILLSLPVATAAQ